jgi:hypothetical protein
MTPHYTPCEGPVVADAWVFHTLRPFMPQVLHLVEISPSHQTQVSLGMLRGQGEGLHDEVRINPRWFLSLIHI